VPGRGGAVRSEDNKAVVRRFLLDALGELNAEVVDEVFAPDHVLSGPEFGTEEISGTEIIKDAIEQFREEVGEVECTIQRQIEEGEWVATSYTLSEERDVHMGILYSRVVAGNIQQSHVVARTVPAAEAASSARRAFN
jgi:hypothetical protein